VFALNTAPALGGRTGQHLQCLRCQALPVEPLNIALQSG
jgi:hypothetical protein